MTRTQIEELLDQVDYHELFKQHVQEWTHYAHVSVWIKEDSISFDLLCDGEFYPETDGLIGYIRTTGGYNSFLWDGYASYDEDGQLAVNATGEVIQDVSDFIEECVDVGDWDDAYRQFRDELRDQLLEKRMEGNHAK